MTDRFKILSSGLNIDQKKPGNTCKGHCLEEKPDIAKVCRKVLKGEEGAGCVNYERASGIIKQKAEDILKNK